MANISSDLQNYLSKSSNSSSPTSSISLSSSKNYLGWFSRSEESLAKEENGNGWFSQAQKDPLLPGLVSIFFAFCLLAKSCLSYMIQERQDFAKSICKPAQDEVAYLLIAMQGKWASLAKYVANLFNTCCFLSKDQHFLAQNFDLRRMINLTLLFT